MHILEKNSSNRNLGPGRYPTPTPPPGTGYTFSYSNRFQNVPTHSISANKSSDKIKENKKIEKYSPLQQCKSSREKFKMMHIKEVINKQTKIIIEAEKKQKIVDRIKEKFHRIDIRKHKHIRNSITETFSTITAAIMIPFVLMKRFSKRNVYMRKINKYKTFLMFVSKVIGKLRLLKRRANYNISMKIFKKYLPQLIKRKLHKMKNRFQIVILNTIDKFIGNCSIPKITFMITKKIKLIQNQIKMHLVTNKIRKETILLLWNRNDKNKEKISSFAKNYYIARYIKIQRKKYLETKENNNRLQVFFTERNHDNFMDNFIGALQNYKTPVLQIYSQACIKKLIADSYKSRGDWDKVESMTGSINKLTVVTIREDPVNISKNLAHDKKRKTIDNSAAVKAKMKRKSCKIVSSPLLQQSKDRR